MQLLTDADDRLNLARACAQMSAGWLPAYLAKAIAEEETGEKARTEMMAALLARSPDLATALRELVNAFQALRPSTEDPGGTAAKRLARTLAALRNTLLEVELDAGDEPGKALYEMLALPLSNLGKPQTEKVQIDLAREALLTVHDIVRTRISVVADPQIAARGMILEQEHPKLGRLRLPDLPFRFSAIDRPVPAPAPGLGQDNAAIAQELGFGEDEIAEMLETGALYTAGD